MNTRVALVLLVTAAQALWSAQATAQVSQSQVTLDLALLQDPAWQNRSAAFYDLLKQSAFVPPPGNTYAVPGATSALLAADAAQADGIRLGLVNALSIEDDLVNAGALPLPETYTDYYADLIAAVATLHDSRAVRALLGAVTTGGLATTGLGSLGAAAYGPTVALLSSSKSDDVRESTVFVLSAMLDSLNTANPDGKGLQAALAEQLKRALSDTSPGVRTAALDGIAKLPEDSTTVQALQAIATGDPYEASQAGGDAGVFPVRGAAQRALAKIHR